MKILAGLIPPKTKFFALWCYFFMTISLIPKGNKSLTIPFHADIFKQSLK